MSLNDSGSFSLSSLLSPMTLLTDLLRSSVNSLGSISPSIAVQKLFDLPRTFSYNSLAKQMTSKVIETKDAFLNKCKSKDENITNIVSSSCDICIKAIIIPTQPPFKTFLISFWNLIISDEVLSIGLNIAKIIESVIKSIKMYKNTVKRYKHQHQNQNQHKQTTTDPDISTTNQNNINNDEDNNDCNVNTTHNKNNSHSSLISNDIDSTCEDSECSELKQSGRSNSNHNKQNRENKQYVRQRSQTSIESRKHRNSDQNGTNCLRTDVRNKARGMGVRYDKNIVNNGKVTKREKKEEDEETGMRCLWLIKQVELFGGWNNISNVSNVSNVEHDNKKYCDYLENILLRDACDTKRKELIRIYEEFGDNPREFINECCKHLPLNNDNKNKRRRRRSHVINNVEYPTFKQVVRQYEIDEMNTNMNMNMNKMDYMDEDKSDLTDKNDVDNIDNINANVSSFGLVGRAVGFAVGIGSRFIGTTKVCE